MKIALLLILNLFLWSTCIAQSRAIKVSHPDKQKELILKENKKVLVKTKIGERHVGRLQIINDYTITVNNVPIYISDIEKIKKHPLLMYLPITALSFFIASNLFAVIPLVALLGFPAEILLLTIPGAGLVYVGKKQVNILKGYKVSEGYTIEIISVSK